MTTYIYRNRQTNFISVGKKPRESEEEVQDLELLYKLEDVDAVRIQKDLRPYQCLWLLPICSFKNAPEVLEYFEGEGYSFPQDISLIELSSEDMNSKLNELTGLIKNFSTSGVIHVKETIVEKNKEIYKNSLRNITYLCDIYNYLSDIYGEKITSLLQRFEKLSPRKKEFLEGLKKNSTREKQTEYLSDIVQNTLGDDFDSMVEFLPMWYRVRYNISKNKLQQINSKVKSNVPECTITELIGTKKEESEKQIILLKKKINKTFKLGETYPGWYIIEKLQEIYNQIGITTTAKIRDLLEYYEYKKVNNNPVSSYRLISKK